jgi:hypothetical protein
MRLTPVLSSLLAGLFLAGCAGYRLGPVNGDPAGARSVEIRPFINRTFEPRLSEYMSLSMRKAVQKDGTYFLETQGPGDIVVSGEVVEFERNALSYLPNDTLTPQDYRLTLTARVIAIDRSTGKTNINRKISGHTSIRIGRDLSSSEREAIPLLTDDLARNAISAIADTPW